MCFTPIATPFPAVCLSPNVVARGEAPKRKWGWRLPSFWNYPSSSGCYFNGSAYHNCSYGVCKCQPQAKQPRVGARLPIITAITAASEFSRHGISSSSQPPPPPDDRAPTTPPVSLPSGFQSPPVSARSRDFAPVDCTLRLRVDEAFASYREDDRDWSDAWRTQQSCSASRHAALISHLHADREDSAGS